MLARLAAVADGTGATVAGIGRTRREYGQAAVVARLWRAAPHAGIAYERFTPDGPIALLPEGDHYGLVWTVTPQRAEELCALDDAAFLAALAPHFGARIGSFTKVADRRAFPLALEIAGSTVGARCVVLGNAAQTLHPVAGQGFNLGLRDAFGLAQAVLDAPRERIGERAMLEAYARRRRPDRWAGIALTHGLVRLFGNDLPFLLLAARVGAHSPRYADPGEARVHARDAVRPALIATHPTAAAAHRRVAEFSAR